MQLVDERQGVLFELGLSGAACKVSSYEKNNYTEYHIDIYYIHIYIHVHIYTNKKMYRIRRIYLCSIYIYISPCFAPQEAPYIQPPPAGGQCIHDVYILNVYQV